MCFKYSVFIASGLFVMSAPAFSAGGSSKKLAIRAPALRVSPVAQPATPQPAFKVLGENHPAFVSAAQYGGVTGIRVVPNFGLSDRDGVYSLTPTGSAGAGDAASFDRGYDVDYAISSQNIGIVALQQLPLSQVRAGLKLAKAEDQVKFTVKSKAAGSDNFDGSVKTTKSEFGPFVSVPVSPEMTVAVEYYTGSATFAPGNSAAASTSYAVFSPSVLYNGKDFEVGAKYEPTIRIEEQDISFARVGGVTFHGRVADRSGDKAWFGVLKYAHNRNVDAARKNSFELTGGADLVGGSGNPISLYGIYKARSFKDRDGCSPDSVAQYGAGVGGNFIIARNGQLGADLKWLNAEGSSGDLRISEQRLAGTLAGSFAF